MNEHWKSPLIQLVLPVLMLVAAICTGSLALGLWRALQADAAHDARVLMEQHKFHAESVAAIQKLAESAGMLTSADLCPVRFRLRFENGHTIPLHRPEVQLETISATDIVRLAYLSMNANGTIDCGLNPPGFYRLTMEMPDGMSLVHDFDVLPGVPVDRMVVAPRSSAGEGTAMQVAIDWGDLSTDTPLMAVCRIEPAPAVLGEWRWQANPDWQPVYAVATNCPPHPEDMDRLTLQMAAKVCPADQLLVPYQYMHLTEMTFFARPPVSEAAGDELIDLGTVRFRIAGNDTAELTQATTSWTTAAPPPCFERHLRWWTVSLPANVVEDLRAHLDRSSAEDIDVSAATISGVLRLGDHSSDSH